MYFPLARYDGYCADCHTDQPLVLVERGPRGLRAWLSGAGAEDRTLSYSCLVCGRGEHVPLTEAEDAVYDATLLTWPDTFTVDASHEVTLAPVRILSAPRKPVVRVIHLPSQRVSATDDLPLALAVA